MKKKSLLLLLTLGVLFCGAQDNEWTKTDRNEIYEECLNSIKYKNISQEQKENIALCYLDEVTKKYKKNEYHAMIDAEIRKFKDATLQSCAKIAGFDIKNDQPKSQTDEPVKAGKKVTEGNFTREDLVGAWRNENAKLFFNEDNSFVAKGDNGDSFGSTWYINKEKNIVIEGYGTLYVKSFDGKTLKYQQTLKTKVLGVTTKKKNEFFTATKIE